MISMSDHLVNILCDFCTVWLTICNTRAGGRQVEGEAQGQADSMLLICVAPGFRPLMVCV